MAKAPESRILRCNDAPLRRDGEYILYWMIANRRTQHNFALEHAVACANELGKPLVIFEALRCDYPWASDRLHAFVIAGIADNRAAIQSLPTDARPFYYPYLAPTPAAGDGLLAALASRAAVVVTDDYPCFFLPRMVGQFARRCDVRVEAIDANGLLPMRAATQAFTTAMSFRRYWQKSLVTHLAHTPVADPLKLLNVAASARLLPAVQAKWPVANLDSPNRELCASLPIDHTVGVSEIAGGSIAAAKTLRAFVARRLDDYPEHRNDPDDDAASGLSPYLHFGHLAAHTVFAAILKHEEVQLPSLHEVCARLKVTGKREAWWGLSPAAEAFLDQLLTWRELGFNGCALRADYARYSSLPDWALRTLEKHRRDVRPRVYHLDALETAKTYDPLWNAAQRQLVREGRMQNYLRMLWGKKILEWSASPEAALEVMIELNNKYALDGRDPNSYSGIFWTLGRYDRAWGPERPIFGTIRYMSSDNTARKLNVKQYLARYAD